MRKDLILILIGCLMMALVGDAQTSTNLILDYDSIYIDSTLRAGDSGILRFVIENNGGQKAEKVIVWIPDIEDIYASKRLYVGTILPDEAVTISARLNIARDASMGLRILPVHVMYTGYDSGGKKEEYQELTYEIPIRIHGRPNFQISPSEVRFFKDVPSELVLRGTTESEIRDVSATVSSDCISVIGSTKKYLGDLDPDQNFSLEYEIKPSSIGMCDVSVSLYYINESGSVSTESIVFGLNIQNPDVDIKVIGVNYTQISPGSITTLILKLKNMGDESATDITVSLDLDDPFIPVQTSEKYVDELKGNETEELEFTFSVSSDAETKAYKIPLKIEYEIDGAEYNTSKNIGVDVTGKVQLEVISIRVRRDKLQIEIANVGTRTAYAVKAMLKTEYKNKTETEIAYKDDIKPNKPTTFSFQIPRAKKGELILEYSGANNERVKVNESVDIPGVRIRESSGGGGGFPLWGVAIIVIIIAVIMYKLKDQF